MQTPFLIENNSFFAKIIIFITNHQEVKKILMHIDKETERDPPLPAIIRYELEDSCDWGDFPPDEAYFVMKNGAFKPQGSLL